MKSFLISYAVSMTVVFFITLWRSRQRHEKDFYEYQDRVMSAQMEEMNHIYMTMRGWRHDYHNHMQKIRAHLAFNQLQEAEAYLDQMETELKSIDILYKTGNPTVNAILNSKLTLAKKNGLEIKCDTVLPETLGISAVDLCVLLGNLIDNAIEACEKMETGERRFLRIYLCTMKNQLYISVSNATNEIIRRLDKEYISKKRGNHGYGLRRIDLIVEKYDGIINRQNEPGVFATEVLLPLPDLQTAQAWEDTPKKP